MTTDQDEDLGEVVEFEGVDTSLSFGKILLGLLVLATFGVWGYAYSGLADRPSPDQLDDTRYGERAEAICSQALEDLDQLPNALDASTSADRADQLRRSNVILTAMLDDLLAELDGPPSVEGSRDRGIIELWIERWRVIVADRADYADRLEVDPDAFFYLSAEAGRRAERSLTFVADNNNMPSCGAPDDVG